MKYIFLFSLLVFSLLLACTQEKVPDVLVNETNGEFIHHVSPDQSKNINAESQLKNLSFIPLEGTSRSLLGGIEKLDQDSVTGYWYILGDKRKNAITVFEKDGKFVKRIKHIGNGPGEYQQINDFYLADGKWVEILDGRRQKLLKFDLNTDTLVTEKKLPFYAWKYSYLENRNYVFYKNSQANNLEEKKYFFKILVIDEDMNIIRSRFPFTLEPGQMNFSIMQPNVLSSSPKSVLFNEFNADTLYLANTDTIKPAHFLDFGRYTFPSSDNREFSSAKEKIQYFVKNSNEYIVGANNVVETSQEFSFVFIYDNFPYVYYWNKKNNKALVIKEIQYGNKSNILPPPSTYTSLYIGIITWERLQNLSLGQLEKGKPMFEAVSIAKEKYKNPVLVLYNFNL